MEEKLIEALSVLDIPVFNLRGDESLLENIVYKITEVVNSYADNEEDLIEYRITIVLFIRGGLKHKKDAIKKSLKSSGFLLSNQTPPPLISDKTDIIQQAIECRYYENVKLDNINTEGEWY